jgi:hypothetical protein
MPFVGFEPTILAFERSKTVRQYDVEKGRGRVSGTPTMLWSDGRTEEIHEYSAG